MPEGYETPYRRTGQHRCPPARHNGLRLARALYGDPFLVVLDEPNSNLDAEGDEALTRAILGVRARKGIVVVVAHRPSAIAGLDLILVMNKGSRLSSAPKTKSSPRS